ncbi:MAG TPA: peroxiredoxin [Candidatus Saccharimonadales bacterium]|nr:peroxiredoxin [Candidatus Saccharimonadales bacterium]
MSMQQPPYPAPDFELADQTNKRHSLKDYAGQWLVVYFYPKDDTPGCTKEACSFRDGRDDIAEQTGAAIVGISKDNSASHQKFIEKFNLTFPLLSDPDGKVVEAYGAWGPKQFGQVGILRRTFLIDPEGIVRKVYGRVTPDGHAAQVLAELKQLQAV